MAKMSIQQALIELDKRIKDAQSQMAELNGVVQQSSATPEVNVDLSPLGDKLDALKSIMEGSKPVDRTGEIVEAISNIKPGSTSTGFQYEKDRTGRIRIMQANGEFGPWFSLFGGGGGPSVVGIAPGSNTVTIEDGGGSITVDGEVSLDAATLAALEEIDVNVLGEVSINDGGNSITVDGTVTIDDSTPVDVNVATDATLVAEDSPHTTGDLGRNVYGVRNDSDTVFTDTDLDYSPIATDSAGAIKVVNGATPLSIITDNSTTLSVESEQPGIPGVVVADSRWSATAQGNITLGSISAVSPVAGVNERIVVDWWNFNVGAAVGLGSGLLTPTVTIEETTSGTDLWCQSSIVGNTLANLFGNNQGPPILIGSTNDSVTFIHPQATIALLTIGVCMNFGGYIIDVS